MSKNLVIVESPAKAKTIEGFLGKDFTVKSSFGHIRDLEKSEKGVDVEKNFKPLYIIPPDKKKTVEELKEAAKKSDIVWLATDEDREGEAISWHLFEALKLDEKKTKRIVFHEITKPAIQKAIANPRGIDKNLVDAQQARRVLDRLVGFELSPILWKQVSSNSTLSAGRVQSVAVRLIVEREREIEAHLSTSSFKVSAYFTVEEGGKTYNFKAELPNRFKIKEEAQAFLEKLKNVEYKVKNIEKKPATRSPAAPFTTSTLQQEASRKLYFSVSQTMTLAQRLYEAGKITYMRTDSVNLSETAIMSAKEEIISSFGSEYANPRQHITKSKSAQEAHEAIRPTYFDQKTISSDDDGENRLYELIWKRTIASQMADAELEKTIVTIVPINPLKNEKAGDAEFVDGFNFISTGEVIKFDGFLKVYLEDSDEEAEESTEGMLPPMITGQKLNCLEVAAVQKFTLAPPRYTEASLVKKLEALGIGRPSTYAPTISTIQKREYVEKTSKDGMPRNYAVLSLKEGEIKDVLKTEITGAEKNKLFPTEIGKVVTDFLMNGFKNIMDYNFTAKVEEEFDEIAEGKQRWSSMLKTFYEKFHPTVEAAKSSAERSLGTDPATGREIVVKPGKFGPYVQLLSKDEKEKPKSASLRQGQRIESVTLEEALDLFKLPRTLGEYEAKEISVSIGRFGPYVKHDDKFYSLKPEDDPYTVSTERAIEVIEAKRKADKERVIKVFPGKNKVQILKGRWGPYLVIDKKNIKIPKGTDPEKLTVEDCLKIAEEAASKPKFKGRFKKKAKTKK